MKDESKESKKAVLYSALEVSKICGVVNQTAINWIRGNSLKAFKTPGGQFRVYPDDLAEFMLSRNLRVPEEVVENCKNKNRLYSQSVLIVDDDEGLNAVIAKYLGKKFAAMQIYQAYDGFDAGVQLSEKHPKCIILDLDLPEVNGFDLCRRIKEGENFGKPEIVVITGLDDDSVEAKITELGIKHFFRKPIMLPTLAEVLQNIFFGSVGE